MMNRKEQMDIQNLYDSLEFLKIEKYGIELETIQMNEKINKLLKKSNLLKQSVNNTKQVGGGEEFFSPTASTIKKDTLLDLQSEIKQLENELEVLKEDVEKKIDRCSNINKLLDAVEVFHSNYINKIDNEYKSKTEYGIKILETQESERKRIARDLHDSTVQNLTNMMHKTELCTKLINLDAVRAKLELQVMINTIKSTIKDMRSIIYDLRPMSLDDLGLVATIETYVREIKVNYEVNISLNITNAEIDTVPVVNLTLFRIIQEATSNAIKHGKANKIHLELEYSKEYIYLSIEDNGAGFIHDEKKEVTKDIFSGYGLPMMKERVTLLSGDIKIESTINVGTKISVKVPLITCKEDI